MQKGFFYNETTNDTIHDKRAHYVSRKTHGSDYERSDANTGASPNSASSESPQRVARPTKYFSGKALTQQTAADFKSSHRAWEKRAIAAEKELSTTSAKSLTPQLAEADQEAQLADLTQQCKKLTKINENSETQNYWFFAYGVGASVACWLFTKLIRS